jgi:hypothetical protein
MVADYQFKAPLDTNHAAAARTTKRQSLACVCEEWEDVPHGLERPQHARGHQEHRQPARLHKLALILVPLADGLRVVAPQEVPVPHQPVGGAKDIEVHAGVALGTVGLPTELGQSV